MKEQKVRRGLVWYKKDPLGRGLEWYEKDPRAALVGKCELKGIKLEELQKLFNALPDDLLYTLHEVQESHVPFLQPYCDHRIDLGSYDYFVEARARESMQRIKKIDSSLISELAEKLAEYLAGDLSQMEFQFWTHATIEADEYEIDAGKDTDLVEEAFWEVRCLHDPEGIRPDREELEYLAKCLRGEDVFSQARVNTIYKSIYKRRAEKEGDAESS
jgi:hypothetical protein